MQEPLLIKLGPPHVLSQLFTVCTKFRADPDWGQLSEKSEPWDGFGVEKYGLECSNSSSMHLKRAYYEPDLC